MTKFQTFEISFVEDMDASLFDFQVNGFGGVDFQLGELSADDMRRAVDCLKRHGTGRIFLTLITDEVDALELKLRRIEKICEEDAGLRDVICGYHLEGPYLSSERGYYGAHQVELMRDPELSEFDRLQEAAGGRIRLMTLAPERAGSGKFIEGLRVRGVKVALGHTNASLEEIDTAVAAGAELVTHLGNAVPALLHRHDNIIQRLLSRQELILCLIPDGIHLPPYVLENFYRMRPAEKVFFTTDCMAAAGASPGIYDFLNMRLEVGEDGVVHLPGDERFAGSSLTMDAAERNLVKWLGISPEQARKQCSELPLKFFNLDI